MSIQIKIKIIVFIMYAVLVWIYGCWVSLLRLVKSDESLMLAEISLFSTFFSYFFGKKATMILFSFSEKHGLKEFLIKFIERTIRRIWLIFLFTILIVDIFHHASPQEYLFYMLVILSAMFFFTLGIRSNMPLWLSPVSNKTMNLHPERSRIFLWGQRMGTVMSLAGFLASVLVTFLSLRHIQTPVSFFILMIIVFIFVLWRLRV